MTAFPDDRGRALAVGLLAALLGLASCDSSQTGTDDALDTTGRDGPTRITDPPNQMPEWVDSVEPVPASQVTGEAIVVVDLDFEPSNRVARLILDGVDVTASATDPGDLNASVDGSAAVATPDRLVDDPGELGNPLVTLDPGLHLATVRLLHSPEGFEAGEFEVEGSFTWSFEVL